MSASFRRRRRTSHKGAVAVAVAVLVVLALLIGGVLSVTKGSTSYWRNVDRSYAVALRPLIEASDTLGSEVRSELAALPTQSRSGAQAALDTLSRQGDALATRAATLQTPSPPLGVGPAVTQVLAWRAAAVALVRSTVDRLLQMAPLPVAGPSGAAAAAPPEAPKPLSASAAVRSLTRAQSRLTQADHRYAGARRDLRRDQGAAALPASSWGSSRPVFGRDGPAGLVSGLEASTTLAAVEKVQLVTKALTLTPAPIPAGTPTAGAPSLVPPTRSLKLTVVVSDAGNVPARSVRVSAQLSPQAGGAGSVRSADVSIAAGGSVSVGLGPLRVRPGQTYAVAVSLRPPTGEVAGATTAASFEVHVAPATPPPTTTTTTTAPKHATTTTTGAPSTTTTAAAKTG